MPRYLMVPQALKNAYKSIMAFLPTSLPATEAEFATWSQEVLELGGYPVNNSFKQTLAQMVQLTAKDRVRMPKRYFLKVLKCAIISQNCYYIIQDIKQQEKAKANEEAQQKTAE